MSGVLSYDAVGATRPAQPRWSERPRGYRRHECTVRIGHGAEDWAYVAREVLQWGVKTRSGFAVAAADGGPATAREGVDYRLTARLGPVRVHEPARVVEVVATGTRCGFAYGTRPGHPVSGEEAFVVHRDAEGAVHLTLRSLTRPGAGAWRPLYGVLLLAQLGYRWRYLRSLRRRR